MSASADFDWSLCRVFLSLARRGSISAAARDLGLSHPTVRRRLDQLETTLGATLFTRSQDGVRLTPDGARQLPHAEALEAAAATLCRSAGWRVSGGRIGIAADRLLGNELLLPLLVRLRAADPALRFELEFGDDQDEVLSRPCELALLTEPPRRVGLVASCVATLPTGVFASPDFTRDAGGAATVVGDLREPLLADLGDPVIETRDRAAALAGAAAGAGLTVLPLSVAAKHGGLERVMPELTGELAVWIAFHPDLRDVAPVRHVVDSLRAGFRTYALDRSRA